LIGQMLKKTSSMRLKSRPKAGGLIKGLYVRAGFPALFLEPAQHQIPKSLMS
jgi:hypothetical protein